MTRRPSRRRQRYSVKVEPCLTLQQVAAELGVTAEAVRQTEYRALCKLRAGLEQRGFKRDDFFD